MAVAGFVLILAGFVFASRAGAQSACAQLGVDCSHHDESRPSGGYERESDEDRQARREAAAEARAERKAESDRQKAIRDAEKLAQKQAKERAQEEERQRQAAEAEAARQRAAEAERQKQIALDNQRRQAAFDAASPAMLGGLKGVGGSPAGGNGLGLKGVDDGSRAAERAAWAATIHDPKVAPIAHRLASVVPPLPIPQKEASLDWKQIYLHDDRLEKTTDLVVAGWEMAGLIENSSLLVKVLMISGKGIIGEADGAYVYVMKKDAVYDAALAYTKNPAQAKQFAHLVEDMRHYRGVPPGTDPEMAKAAQAVADPNISDTGLAMWDALTSREAISTAIKKASIEATADLVSYGVGKKTNGFFESVEERKAMYDSIRLERTAARKMLEDSASTAAQKAECTAVIHKADEFSTWIYKTDPAVKRVKEGFEGIAISDATDKAAEIITKEPTSGH